MNIVKPKVYKDKISVYQALGLCDLYKINGRYFKIKGRKMKPLIENDKSIKDKGYTFKEYKWL